MVTAEVTERQAHRQSDKAVAPCLRWSIVSTRACFESERPGLAESRRASFPVFLRRAAAARRAGLSRAGSAPRPAPLLSSASSHALPLATPIAARPRLVMCTAKDPLPLSRRRIGSAPRAGISSIKPWVRRVPTALSAAPPLRLGASLMAPSAPGKTRTFVLDFVNEEKEIYDAFKPYYETTPVGENADPQKLSELHHKLLEWAIFSPDDVNSFANLWYVRKRDHSSADHRKMNALLDAVVENFKKREEAEQDLVRGQLIAFRNLYAFLSQIIPYQDSELEKFYTFVRNLIAKLPPPGNGKTYTLDDEVALRYFRLQQITEGSIDLNNGEAKALKGPTDVGTAARKIDEEALSSLVAKLNERFGTDFTEADQLFFDQIRATAENDERIVEAARGNNLPNFSSYLDRILDELFIDRMEGNEEIFARVMTDKDFRATAHDHLAQEIFRRARGATN
jgi:hypothetical protein